MTAHPRPDPHDDGPEAQPRSARTWSSRRSSRTSSVKKEVFAQARRDRVPGDAILRRTPRRSRSPSSPRATERPDQVIGMHFMNPVPVMKLVEIIRGLAHLRRDLRDGRRI